MYFISAFMTLQRCLQTMETYTPKFEVSKIDIIRMYTYENVKFLLCLSTILSTLRGGG